MRIVKTALPARFRKRAPFTGAPSLSDMLRALKPDESLLLPSTATERSVRVLASRVKVPVSVVREGDRLRVFRRRI